MYGNDGVATYYITPKKELLEMKDGLGKVQNTVMVEWFLHMTANAFSANGYSAMDNRCLVSGLGDGLGTILSFFCLNVKR